MPRKRDNKKITLPYLRPYQIEIKGHPFHPGEPLRHPQNFGRTYKEIRLEHPIRIDGEDVSEFFVPEEANEFYYRSENGKQCSKRYPFVRGYPKGKWGSSEGIRFIIENGKYIPFSEHHVLGRRNNNLEWGELPQDITGVPLEEILEDSDKI